MAVNSLESLLARMKRGSITHGWGAVVAFGRAQLNRLLQEQYLAWLHEGRFIPPISGEVFNENRTEFMKLENLILGRPVLSFASSSLNQSFVTLTMNIVAGTYTAINRPVGEGPQRLLSARTITEDLGFRIQMKLSLHQIQGEVDKRGRVSLDVASDTGMTCNLGDGTGVQKLLAALIQSRLAALPDDQRIFELGLLDFNDSNPLNPTAFQIRTQKSPGSTDPDDGAVVVFVRLKINDENGSMPIEGSDFPYLIPDDKAGGDALYSASMVLNREWIELLDDVQLDVLKSLLLPGENLFVESTNGRHTPHDLLVLGNLKSNPDNVSISPAFINLKAGKTQAFSARKSNGSTVSAQWSVSNPFNPLSIGSITPTGGVLTAPAPTRMGKEQQPMIVTAQYVVGGKQRTRSAMVLGVFESMSISPRICVSGIGTGAQAIELTAGTLGGGTLQWPTLTPAQGTLTIVDNNHAIYIPPAALSEPLVIQTIRVTDSLTQDTIDASIVLMRASHSVPVDPPYVASVRASQPIQLYTELPPEDTVWTVIGEGEVDENGLFTPPAQPTSRVSVVRCTYMLGGNPLMSGFSVIQLSEQVMPDPTWSALDDFSIVAVLGQNRCFHNGFQQIPVIVKIQTKSVSVGGQQVYIPVSDAELSTLQLVDKVSNTLVPYVRFGQEGIERGSGVTWAANKRRNRFRLYSATAVASEEPELPTPQNNGVRYRELWIHLAEEGSRTFYAQFSSDKGIFNSTEVGDAAEGEITVQGLLVPTPDISHYQLKRDRAWQDPDGHDAPPTELNPTWDYFNFYRQSIDYWRLSYSRLGAYPVLFATSRIEGNVSTLQFESELIDETYVSFTGEAFYPAHFANSDSPAPQGLSFDGYLWGLLRLRGVKLDSSFIINKQPSPGELLVSLHRTDDVKYWYDRLAEGDKRKLYRQHLDPEVRFVLMDQEGNRHVLAISFESATVRDSRNTLIIKLR